jgi:hypothetical protein
MSTAFSLVNGRGMSSSESTGSPSVSSPDAIVTTKAPLRGLSALTETATLASLSCFSSFAARDLKTPQLLHASISTRRDADAAAAAGLAAATVLFFARDAGAGGAGAGGASALRLERVALVATIWSVDCGWAR